MRPIVPLVLAALLGALPLAARTPAPAAAPPEHGPAAVAPSPGTGAPATPATDGPGGPESAAPAATGTAPETAAGTVEGTSPPAEVPAPAEGAAGAPSDTTDAGSGQQAATTDEGAAAAPATPQLSAEERARLEELLATLRDDAKREAFLRNLEALLAVSREPQRPTELVTAAETFRDAVLRRVEAVRRAFSDMLRIDQQLAFLFAWLQYEWQDPLRRALWLDVLRQLGLALAAGIAAGLLFRLATRPIARRADAGKPSPRLAALLTFVREVVAVCTFAGVTWGVVLLQDTPLLVRIVARDLLVGVLIARTLAAVAKAMLAPYARPRRLVPLPGEVARPLFRRIVLLNVIFVYGTTLLRIAFDLGLPWTLHGLFQRLLYLVGTVVVLANIARYREPVGAWLAERTAHIAGPLSSFLPWQRLARNWHLAAGGLVLAEYLVFALEIPGGLEFLSLAVLTTLVTVVTARALCLLVDRWFTPRAAEGEEVPDLRRRYLRILRLLLKSVVVVVAVLVVLQAWGLRVLDFLATPTGQALLDRLGRIALVLAVSVAVIEAANLIFRRWLEAKTEDGQPLYGPRTRTLVGILRNLVIVVVTFVGGLVMLSELGVETGPLLAGAGIIGLAVGFGSQKLVQDIINGLFILVGDTIRIGDVVSLGGRTGVVEAMSMRTVQLRSYDGQVHVIPYSSIDTISNMTKDFAYWVVEMGVAYREDVDEVMRVMREVDAEMRSEWPWRRLVLEPIDVAGLDRFGDSAVVIKARIKTRPGEQWRVGREYNRRIKKRFDELGIEIPFPHRTLYFGVDKQGKAPPVFVRLDRDEGSDAPPPSPSSS